MKFKICFMGYLQKIILCLAFVFFAIQIVARPAGALTFCNINDLGHFNPAADVRHLADKSWSRLIYNRLVDLDLKTNILVPALAESWEILEKGKKVRFNLRKKVPFHSNDFFTPSRVFNADDVMYSFERLRDEEHVLHRLHGETYQSYERTDFAELIQEVRKIDDYTVEFSFKENNASLIGSFAQDFASIISKEYGEKMIASDLEMDFERYPIGTGAYALIAYFPNILSNLRKFGANWHDDIGEDNILIVPHASEKKRIEKLMSAECDIIPSISIESTDDIRQQKNVKLLEEYSNKVIYIAYNTKWKPLDKAAVRRGLTLSINKQVIVQAVFNNHAELNNSPVPPLIFGHHDSLKDYKFSTIEARKEMSSEGSVNFEMGLWLPDKASELLPDPKLLGEIIAADWEMAGVKVSTQYVKPSDLKIIAQDRRRQGVVVMISDDNNSNPEDFLSRLLRCKDDKNPHNYAHWCDPVYERIMRAAELEGNLEVRKQYLLRAQEIYNEEAPWTVLANPIAYVPVSERVRGFFLNGFGIYNLRGVTLARK